MSNGSAKSACLDARRWRVRVRGAWVWAPLQPGKVPRRTVQAELVRRATDWGLPLQTWRKSNQEAKHCRAR
jgi:hypothetical protein